MSVLTLILIEQRIAAQLQSFVELWKQGPNRHTFCYINTHPKMEFHMHYLLNSNVIIKILLYNYSIFLWNYLEKKLQDQAFLQARKYI